MDKNYFLRPSHKRVSAPPRYAEVPKTVCRLIKHEVIPKCGILGRRCDEDRDTPFS